MLKHGAHTSLTQHKSVTVGGLGHPGVAQVVGGKGCPAIFFFDFFSSDEKKLKNDEEKKNQRRVFHADNVTHTARRG